MGPINRLEACTIRSLEICYLPEQSGQFRGTALWNLARRDETINYSNGTIAGQAELNGAQFDAPFIERYPPRALTRNAQDLQERQWLDPALLLRRAAVATDLRLKDRNAITFGWMGQPVTVRFAGSPAAPMPSEIEWEGQRIEFWAAWARVSNRLTLSNWQRLPGGLAVPFTRRTERNGIVVFDETVLRAETKLSQTEVPLPADPAPVVSPPLRLPSPKQISPGLWQYPGVFPTEIWEDSDGLTLIDAANTPEFATLLLADLHQRFPKQQLKRVIVTDPYWPHFGGLRTYVAAGAEIICSTRNQRQLAEILADPQAKRRPRFRTINAMTRIGQLQVLPLPGPETDRMLAVYWPQSGIIFTSDTVIFQGPGKLYSVQMSQEMVDTVKAAGWLPFQFFATHCPLRPWSDLEGALRATL